MVLPSFRLAACRFRDGSMIGKPPPSPSENSVKPNSFLAACSRSMVMRISTASLPSVAILVPLGARVGSTSRVRSLIVMSLKTRDRRGASRVLAAV